MVVKHLGFLSLAAAMVNMLSGCSEPTAASDESPGEASAPGVGTSAEKQPSHEGIATAKVGEAAPDFTLKDLDGNAVSLSSFKGKTVVLEWFNPDCPFVRYSHSEGPLKDMAKKHAGVVWLAINSGAVGQQGHGLDRNREAQETYGMDHQILLDESGKVGKHYRATATPHMFVIDEDGVLVYTGAIDNAPMGRTDSGAAVVNYVEDALTMLSEGKAIQRRETPAYGCSVKYGS